MAQDSSLMLMGKRVQQLLADAVGYTVIRAKHGFQDLSDLKRKGCCVHTMFDVGANVGQTATRALAVFPQARILCFEPVSTTFAQLTENMRGKTVECYRLAMGSKPDTATIHLTGCSYSSSLVPSEPSVGQEVVQVTTVDGFAAEHNIDRIDLLKIDTEGFDLEVLKGAQEMLCAGRVGAVLVEIGFHPCDNRHVLFDDVRNFLMERGFSVFGFYDQQLEWTGERRLRFANALFVKEPPFQSDAAHG